MNVDVHKLYLGRELGPTLTNIVPLQQKLNLVKVKYGPPYMQFVSDVTTNISPLKI